MISKVSQGPLRVARVGQQGMASLDFCKTGGLTKTLQPRLLELLGLLQLLCVQIMQAVVVVIILSAGDELPQTHRTILGQGEVLDKIYVARISHGYRENRPRQRNHHAFHRSTSTD